MGYTLRKVTREPTRLEEEEYYNRTTPSKASLITKPQFPELLRDQVIPFNPNLPTAAFPSTTLNGSRGQKVYQNQGIVGETKHEDPELHEASHSSLTTNESSPLSCSGLPRSRDGCVDDELSESADYTVLAEAPAWCMLEISVQHQIFVNLCQFQSPRSAATRLELSYNEFLDIRLAIAKRLQIPGHVDLLWEAVSKLDDGCFGYVDPDKLWGPFNILLEASSYDLAFPLSISKGIHFLDQKQLDRSLIGSWFIAEDGFAHSASNLRQVARRISVGVPTKFSDAHDDDGNDLGEVCGSVKSTVENTTNHTGAPQEETTVSEIDFEGHIETLGSSRALRKQKRPRLMSQSDRDEAHFHYVQPSVHTTSPTDDPKRVVLPMTSAEALTSEEPGQTPHLVLRYNPRAVRIN